MKHADSCPARDPRMWLGLHLNEPDCTCIGRAVATVEAGLKEGQL